MKHLKKEEKLHNKAVKAACHGNLFKAAKMEVIAYTDLWEGHDSIQRFLVQFFRNLSQ